MNPDANPLKIPVPGVLHGNHPERQRPVSSLRNQVTQWRHITTALVNRFRPKSYAEFLQQVARQEVSAAALPAAAIRQRLRETRSLLAQQGMDTPVIATAFGLINVIFERELSTRLEDSQLILARIMLDGKLASMDTGEDKSLAIAICGATAALAGIPVHVVHAGDDEVSRSATKMLPLYAALGLCTGQVRAAHDIAHRRQQYACDITYVSARELMEDYLRDGLTGTRSHSEMHAHISRLCGIPSGTMLRGLCMAVLADAPGILLDEAAVVLPHRQDDKGLMAFYRKAQDGAAAMLPRDDFVLDRRRLSAELTPTGRVKMERITDMPNIAGQRLLREQTICQALAAQYLYRRDRHYRVCDDHVLLLDSRSGRILPERPWSHGLHQILALKEHCQPRQAEIANSETSSHHFFPAYFRLTGIGTSLKQQREALLFNYGLSTETLEIKRDVPSLAWKG